MHIAQYWNHIKIEALSFCKTAKKTNKTLRESSRRNPRNPLNSNLWRSICELGLSRTKPTRRGCRAGLRKLRQTLTGRGSLSQTLLTKSFLPNGTLLSYPISTQNIQDGNDLRYPNADLLNIQVVTSSTDNSNTGVPERALRDHGAGLRVGDKCGQDALCSEAYAY